MTRRDIPNAITSFRLYASLPVIVILYFGWKDAIPWVLLAFASTDYADGKIARRFGWTSEYGQRIDPYADKSLCWPPIVLAFFESNVGAVMAIPAAIFALYDAGGEWLRRQKIVGAPNGYGKWKTATLMLAVIVLWFGFTAYPPLVGAGVLLFWIAAFTALLGAFDHLYRAGILRTVVPAIF